MARMHVSAWAVCLVSAYGLALMTLDAGLAQQPTAAQIIDALKPKGAAGVATRALIAHQQAAPDREFIDSLRNRQTRQTLERQGPRAKKQTA